MLINKGIVLKLTTSAAENSKVAVDVIKKGKSYSSYNTNLICKYGMCINDVRFRGGGQK